MKVPKKKLFFILEMYFQAVDLEDAADASLAYLMRVKQFELLGSLVEVVTQGDAVEPAPDIPRSWSKAINQVAGLEHPAKDGDVDGRQY